MKSPPETWQIGNHRVRVSHLAKLYWPEDGITKGDLLGYYRLVAPVMLPYLKDRPVTMHVFPGGIHGFSYYRRDRPQGAPRWLRSAVYQPETTEGITDLLLIDDAAGLIWLANRGSIEFHMWNSRVPDLSQPDLAVFDLDPGGEASFADVLRAALRLREALERRGLHGYPKTSGRRGLQVYLPLVPGYTFDVVRTWVKLIAEQLASAYPDLIAVPHGPTHQGRRVAVDYAQNSVGRNTVVPYSVRAQPGAPVSTPVHWGEVEDARFRPDDLTLRVVPHRLQQLGDLFAPILWSAEDIGLANLDDHDDGHANSDGHNHPP